MSGVPRAQEWIDQCETLISRRGHRIAFRRRGQGPTVLMLHGFPTWSYDYAEVADDLASDHDVITLDFLGYGASDKPNPYEYSVAESADVVEDLAAHLHLDSVRLVIHDYGGIVGQELIGRALGRPTRVHHRQRRLVELRDRLQRLPPDAHAEAVDCAGHRQVAGRPDYPGPLPFRARRCPRVRDHRRRVRRPLVRRLATRRPQDRAPAHPVQRRTRRPSRPMGEGVGRLGGSAASGVGPRRSGVGTPRLEKATAVLPHAELTELHGVGHFPPSEAPQAVAAAVRKR